MEENKIIIPLYDYMSLVQQAEQRNAIVQQIP